MFWLIKKTREMSWVESEMTIQFDGFFHRTANIWKIEQVRLKARVFCVIFAE